MSNSDCGDDVLMNHIQNNIDILDCELNGQEMSVRNPKSIIIIFVKTNVNRLPKTSFSLHELWFMRVLSSVCKII